MINVRFVTIEKMAELTGYTHKAIEKKIDNGIWKHGNEWRKAPDGRRLVDVEGYNTWVESMLGLNPVVNQALKYLSRTKVSASTKR